MPRDKGEQRLEDALGAVASALSTAGVPWMVIGGIAVIARGVRRLTTDIDVAVRGDAVGLDTLLSVLAREEIRPRIEGARAFAEENLVLLVTHEPTGVDLDVSLSWSGFEHEALAHASEARFGRIIAPMATAADLVVFKALAGRPRDIEDLESLLLLHDEIELRYVRRHVRDLAVLAHDETMAADLERAVRRVRAARNESRPSGKPSASKRGPRKRTKNKR